ncbi:hypothetical protein BPOR_0534g00010 [Botrytis porri]|uniref:Uncharacterized protein n=1 Tax=Botrytis porri TaxID=87229 RepID=A0A4Z1KIY7_9HELO|nr:hypothetical protein BPOR_0534g00010 [Botrytis porri]
MVICLGTVPDRPHYVKVMTLRNNRSWVWSRGQQTLLITTLPEPSYLKIDEFYEVPFLALREVKDKYGILLSVPAKHRGGLAELKLHIRRRDSERDYEKLCRGV